MTPDRRAPRAIAEYLPDIRLVSAATGLGVMALIATAQVSIGQEAEGGNVQEAFGYSNYDELQYGPDDVLDYVNPDAPKGGEISTWTIGTFDSFNQATRKGVPAALNTVGYERLMISTADDPYAAYCFLCTTVEWPEDKSWVIFNLRDDVTFQDGTPMTAEDVKFTHELFLEQGIAEYRRLVDGYYDEVEILGPHRIRFNFSDDAPVRDRVFFAGGTLVFSKDWFEENEVRLDETSDSPFMATGPYVLEDFDYNRQIIYARDPNYWGADLPMNQGRNNFDRIRVEYFTDAGQALEGFKSGEYLFRIESEPQDWFSNYNFNALNNGFVTREEVPDGNVADRLSWVFNLDREKWQDKRVRDAVGMMFNFAWSNRALYHGAYEQPISFWSGTDLAAEGVPSEEEAALLTPLVEEGLLDPAILTDPAPVPVEHDAAENRPNRRLRAAASNLLEEAGWTIGSGGTRTKDGEVLELVIIQYDPSWDKLVNPFIENLRDIGIDARLERVDSSQYVERRRAGQFDLANQRFQTSFEPSVALEQWFASKTADDSSRNLMRLRNEAIDRLIGPVASADTLDGLETAVHAFDRALRWTGFDIPLYYNPVTFVAYYNVYAHPEDLPPLALGQYDFWWWDEDAAEELRSAGVL